MSDVVLGAPDGGSIPLDLEPIKTREAAATKAPWAWGRLIGDQAGDYVVWCHRGADETTEHPATGFSGKGPQRTYVGTVGGIVQPVIEADTGDVFANQVFEAESADAAFIAHARSDIPALIAEVEALRVAVGQQPREHDGFEFLMEKLLGEPIYGVKPLLPDARFGQDVALVAHLLDTLRGQI